MSCSLTPGLLSKAPKWLFILSGPWDIDMEEANAGPMFTVSRPAPADLEDRGKHLWMGEGLSVWIKTTWEAFKAFSPCVAHPGGPLHEQNTDCLSKKTTATVVCSNACKQPLFIFDWQRRSHVKYYSRLSGTKAEQASRCHRATKRRREDVKVDGCFQPTARPEY